MKKKTIVSVLIAGCLSILGGAMASTRSYRFSGMICVCLAAVVLGYWVLALFPGPVTRWLRRGLTMLLAVGMFWAAVTGGVIAKAGMGNAKTACEYVIVLGAGLNGKKPAMILSERLDAAAAYLDKNPQAVCIVAGGQGPDEEITEAAAMESYLADKGIDTGRIWQEDTSTSTWENLQFSLKLIEEKTGQRPKTVGVVSNEFHLLRAGMMAQRQGVAMVGIPARTQSWSLRTNYFLREIAAVWKLLAFGG